MSLDENSVLVRWARKYHWSGANGKTICGIDVPGGAIKRGVDFGNTVAETDAMCKKCRELSVKCTSGM